MFLERYAVKRVCNVCNYSSCIRCGDLSLSDYPYSISNKIDPEEKGVSVIYLNSLKGKKLFENVSLNLHKTENSIIKHFIRKVDLEVLIKREKTFRSIYKKSLKNEKHMIKFCDSIKNKKISKIRLFLSKLKHKIIR